MAKLSYTELKAIVSSYVSANKIATATFTATKDNLVGLLDKVGKILTLDTNYMDKLALFEGEALEFGKTIEEWQQDLILPVAYDATGADALAPTYPTYMPVAYSYTLGRKVIPTTIKYNDVERAVNNGEQLASIVSMQYKRLSDSEAQFRYDAKREILAKLINACVNTSSAVVFNASLGRYTAGALVKESANSDVYVVVKKYAGESGDWDSFIDDGYAVKRELFTTMSIPTDTSTGEAFIEQVKKDVEIASDSSEGHSLNGNSLGATEGLVLIVKNGVMPVIDVKVNAGSYHLDKVAIPAEVIPVKDFGSDTNKAFAVLMDRRGARLHQDYRAVREQPNGKGDFLNLFLHLEFTAYYSRNTFVKVYKEA